MSVIPEALTLIHDGGGAVAARQQRRNNEVEMREAVLHQFERLWLVVRTLERLIGKDPCGREGVELGQAPQSAPDAALRPALKEHRAVLAHGDQHDDLSTAADAWRSRRRNLMLASAAPRDTSVAQGTDGAERFAPHAHRRPEVHDRLGIYRGVVLWRTAFGELPQALDCCGVGRGTRYCEEARKHALGVAVENGEWFTVAQCEDGTRRGAADSRQCHKLGKAAGKIAAKLIADVPCSAMQVARASVIAKPGP